MADKKEEFTLEDILEEQRREREEASYAGQADNTRKPEEHEQRLPVDDPVSDDTADLAAYATGNFQAVHEDYPQETIEAPEPPAEKSKRKKKKKGGLFGRKKKMPDFDEDEDMYYGIQLKPIDEYRKGFDPATGEFSLAEDSFKNLFDDSKKAIDDEVEANFQKLQRERRRRVAEAVQTAGVDEREVAEEFGVVAPMPVTAFAADPYAKQHGIEVETPGQSQEELSGIQKAMMETSTDKTMEIKLNVLNDTVEIQRVKDMPVVSDESVNKILSAAEKITPEISQPQNEGEAAYEAEPGEEIHSGQVYDEALEYEASAIQGDADETVVFPQESGNEAQTAEPSAGSQPPVQEDIITSRPLGEIPQVASIYEYRSRSIPTHIINADVLQSALLSESEELQRAMEEERPAPRRRVRNKKPEEEQEEYSSVDTGESIEDYTGPEDAKSISNELRGDMRELSLRMMITGVCTVLLAVVNMIFGSQFSAGGDLGSMPLIYVILNVVFLGVAAGVCYRTIGNGLRALFSLNANSDSAAAVATVAVGIQTIASMFFRSDLTGGKLHLYGVLLAAALFVNAAGKLAMIRRIHSNFRFVTSREQKYSVRTYDDYNTALKMTKDCVAEKPVIAYQCKTGFLKRFLELSYSPDPSETASQLLAPIGLIASLVLCIVCLLITRSVSTALSAFAAATCACVAVSNMLSVNLPISRLCKTARRAGAMVVGYEAVEQLGSVNAVVVDAEEIFPLGTVVLGGIKTFGNRAGAEEAIMAASALMKELGGPLSGVFDQVISENEDSLPEVEKFSYEDGGGIVGRVDGKKIYIGNRSLLINHRIEVPAREEETQYASGNKSIIYIGVDTVVSAMLVLTYSADRRRKNELQRLEDSGISVLVRTTDPNVTSAMVSRLFGIDVASVGILEGQLGDIAHELTQDNIPRADAVVATKGRMESMINVISACVEEKRTVGVIVAIQNAAVILGFVLVAFMACFGGMGQLSSFILFMFELFWLLAVIAIPKFRK